MRVTERGVVFDASNAPPGERCCGFTSLARLADGTLLCSFKSGPTKLGHQDRLILMRSSDDGRRWARLFDRFDTTLEGTLGSFSGGYLFEARPGRLLISLHWVDRTDPALPLSNPKTSGVLPMKYLLAESEDGGQSWSRPREVSLAPHPGANPTCEIQRLQNGQLLLAYESWKEWDDVEGNQSANVKFSSDEGKTWGEPVTMASDATGRFYYWDNHLTLHPRTKELLAGLWTHDAGEGIDAPIHLAWGDPTGARWSTPSSTNIQGQVVAPLFLDDDRLLLAYVHRHDPPSIRGIISPDRGATWDMDREFIIHDCQGHSQQGMKQQRSDAEYWSDMTRWTFGHPKAIRLAENQVLVVYYAPASADHIPTKDVPSGQNATPTSIYWAKLES